MNKKLQLISVNQLFSLILHVNTTKMKFFTLIFTLVIITGCKKNNKNPEPTPEPDCNCDRVVQVSYFTSIGNCSGTSSGTYGFGPVVTINDCSEIQINGNWNECEGDAPPVVGECFNH